MSFNAYRIWKMEPVLGTPELTIVLPVRDETATIVADIACIAAHMCKRTSRWELIVADDSASDSTARLIADLDLANVTVVSPDVRGAAIGITTCRALTSARGTTVAVMETRGAVRIDAIDSLIAAIQSGADLAAGAGSLATPERLIAMSSTAAHRLSRAVLPAAGAPLGHDPIGTARQLDLRVRVVAARRRRDRDPETAPIRVAFVTSLAAAGPQLEASALELVSGLIGNPEIGHLTLLHDTGHEPPAGMGHDRLSTRAAWRNSSCWNALRIAREARRARADVVVFDLRCSAFGRHRAAAALTHLAPLMLRMRRIPTVMLLSERIGAGTNDHMTTSPQGSRLCRLVTRVSLQATRVVVTDPSYAAELAEHHRATNVFVAPALSASEARSRTAARSVAALPHPTRRIVAIGAFEHPTQVDALLDGFALLSAAGCSDVQFVVAARDAVETAGCTAQLTERAARMAGVTVTGRPDDIAGDNDLITGLLDGATSIAVVFGSDARNGAMLRRAASAHVALVVADRAGPHHNGTHDNGAHDNGAHDNGLIAEHFDTVDAMSLAGALLRLLDDDQERDARVAHNAAAVRAFDIRTTASWHIANLESLTRESLTRSSDHGMS